ncbi:MAG: NADH-quinone oxidoreductase subunit N [Planctomycetota bacterium]
MSERLAFLWPEVCLFLATCGVMLVGLSPSAATRRLCSWIAGLGLSVAGVLAIVTTPTTLAESEGLGLLPNMLPYAKAVIAGVGVLLVPVLAGTVDRAEEHAIARGERSFDPLRVTRGEFFAFFLFSMTGLMLTASADDLIWLFLALELTSLPTYIMVTISTPGSKPKSQESGVKYFFLGALGAAVFLFGFALLYGGTGTTVLSDMPAILGEQAKNGGISPIAMGGLVISFLGVCFKVAAVPMHAYTADVYQGSASGVSAMLAFVPKTAGFIAMMLLAAAVGWHYTETGAFAFADLYERGQLPQELRLTLFVVAALTMTVGNVLAVLQDSAKRMFAYSSIAHSGYMLVGVIAGPGLAGGGFMKNGLSAVLLYLLIYGITNTGVFAVLASLEKRAEDEARRTGHASEIDAVEDLRGLCGRDPLLGWTLVVCTLSLLGFPPLAGFFGKVPLFSAGIAAGEIVLVVILGLNSAMAAFYYLRVVNIAMFDRDADPEAAPVRSFAWSRISAAATAGACVLVLTVLFNFGAKASRWAGQPRIDAAAIDGVERAGGPAERPVEGRVEMPVDGTAGGPAHGTRLDDPARSVSRAE